MEPAALLPVLPVLPVTPLIAPNSSLSTKPQAFPVPGYAVAEDPGHKCSGTGWEGDQRVEVGLGGLENPLELLFE